METTRPEKNLDEKLLSPEEIKAIGEIELGPAKHEVFLNKHYKKLIWGGLCIVLAASLGVGYYSYQEQQKAEAGALIVQASGAYSPQGALSPAKYDAKILSQILNEYGSTPSAATAELMEALSLLTDPAHAESGISRLESIMASQAGKPAAARAASFIAAWHMQEKNTGKAMEYWQKVVDMPLNPYTALACVNMGDLSKAKGDIEAARAYYTKVRTEYANSPLASDSVAGIRLALLGVDEPRKIDPPSQEKEAASPTASPYSLPGQATQGTSQPAPQPTGGLGDFTTSFSGDSKR